MSSDPSGNGSLSQSGKSQSTSTQHPISVPATSLPNQPVSFPSAQSHHQHLLAALPQGAQMDAACSQLLLNPHTAAMVATVAAAAAQQMAQQQHHAMSQAQALQAQVQTASSATSHPMVYHPAPPSATPPPSQIVLPPHLAALLGVQMQPPNVYGQHGTAVASSQVVTSGNAQNNPSNVLLSQMQTWKLKQLEAHAQMLRDTNQPISQPLAMLLADARRKEEKRTAKRVANRKSACTSRARKKALVEEMTRTNARLKRQAMILALLPDMVIAITVTGEITFCSAQVERVLRHKVSDMVGSNLTDLITHSSHKALRDLVKELVDAEREASKSIPVAAVAPINQANHASLSGSSIGVAVVSDQSIPPLSVVKVESQQSASEENSDLSTINNDPKHTPSTSHESVAAQSMNDSEGNDAPKTKRKSKQPSSDDSLSSSSDNKNLVKANENLDRNVRWHNEKSKASKVESCHKDDVTGDAVTANNAGARLSSLQHRPGTTQNSLENLEVNSSSSSSDSMLGDSEEKKPTSQGKTSNGSSSDESGYRESREDTESSENEEASSAKRRRPKPLAPTCNICLIRDDLTTIWCEVTSSIRTRSLHDESSEIPQQSLFAQGSAKECKGSGISTCDETDDVTRDEVKELLLCLRPIREGEEKVDAAMGFHPVKPKFEGLEEDCHHESFTNSQDHAKGPVKKRQVWQQENNASITTDSTRVSTNESSESEPMKKKSKSEGTEDDTEKSVVESLMLMGKK